MRIRFSGDTGSGSLEASEFKRSWRTTETWQHERPGEATVESEISVTVRNLRRGLGVGEMSRLGTMWQGQSA